MKFLKKLRIDFLYLLILSITTIYIWYPLSKLILQWESYTYLNRQGYRLLFTHPWESLANFDMQSMSVGIIISKLFGLNMPMYFWLEILSILSINIIVYFLTKTLTKNSTSAFVASFIFTVYFFGIGFFIPTYYATFLQRVIFNVPLLLVSFLFLHRFLAEKKSKYYAISLFLFFLSIFLAHFGILLAYPIFLYPVFWEIFSLKYPRSIIRGFLIAMPYVMISIFFWQIQIYFGENLGRKENIIYFLTHPQIYHYIEAVVRQLVYMSQYPTVIQALKLGVYPLAFSDPTSTYKFVYSIILTYIISFIIIWKKEKNIRALLLTIISSLIISLTINIYLNRSDFLNAAGFNRYYYYPSLFLAIYWSLFLTSIFPKKGFIIIYAILIGFFLINAALFRQHFFDLYRYSLTTKGLYEYIVHNYKEFPSNSFIIVGPTADFGPYETAFITEQLGQKRGITFGTEDRSYKNWRTLASTATNVLRLNYDKKCACVLKEILK